jgi:hypothetical protein
LVPQVLRLVAVRERLHRASKAQAWAFASFDGQEVRAFEPKSFLQSSRIMVTYGIRLSV